MNIPEDDLERSLRHYFEDFDENLNEVVPPIRTTVVSKTRPAIFYRKWAAVAAVLLVLVVGENPSKEYNDSKIVDKNINRGFSSANNNKNFNKTIVGKSANHKVEKSEISREESSALSAMHSSLPCIAAQTKQIIAISKHKKERLSAMVSNQRKSALEGLPSELYASFSISTYFKVGHIEASISQKEISKIKSFETKNTGPHTTIEQLKAKEYRPFVSELALPKVKMPENNLKSKSVASHLVWSFSIQPFQTYQYLTNNEPKADFYINNLCFPSWVNKQRMGFQVRVGAEIKRNERFSYRVGGLYRSMPQFIHYQVSTNEFLVKELGPNQISIERVMINVNEQQTLHFVGLQADYLYRLKHDFFVSLGAEGTTDLENNNTQLGATVSMGWGRKLNQHHTLSIEPIYTYFFHKSADSRQIFQIQPFTVGLKVGIMFE